MSGSDKSRISGASVLLGNDSLNARQKTELGYCAVTE